MGCGRVDVDVSERLEQHGAIALPALVALRFEFRY